MRDRQDRGERDGQVELLLWTFLLRAWWDRGLRDGVEHAAVLPGVVPVADALHLITAGLQEQEREMKIRCFKLQFRGRMFSLRLEWFIAADMHSSYCSVNKLLSLGRMQNNNNNLTI